MQTVEQKRAADAVRKIQGMINSNRDYGHYVSYASALPAQIVNNGLGQAITMLCAAAGRKTIPHEDPHYFLADHVASWLAEQIQELRPTDGVNHPVQVVQRLAEGNQKQYSRATAEAVAYLNWLKRFARAMLTEPGETPDGSENTNV